MDRGQWAIINECRGSEDVLIKREDFSFPKIVQTRDGRNLRSTVGRERERERMYFDFEVIRKKRMLISPTRFFIFHNWPSLGRG